MTFRETGSIVVAAPRQRVFETLRERMASEPGLRTVTTERLESERKTFVLRDAPDGSTRVVCGRTSNAGGPRLRAEVGEELLSLQKLLAP